MLSDAEVNKEMYQFLKRHTRLMESVEKDLRTQEIERQDRELV